MQETRRQLEESRIILRLFHCHIPNRQAPKALVERFKQIVSIPLRRDDPKFEINKKVIIRETKTLYAATMRLLPVLLAHFKLESIDELIEMEREPFGILKREIALRGISSRLKHRACKLRSLKTSLANQDFQRKNFNFQRFQQAVFDHIDIIGVSRKAHPFKFHDMYDSPDEPVIISMTMYQKKAN